LNWSVVFKNEGISLFYYSYPKGTYELLPKNSCRVCAFPETEDDTCPWECHHPEFLTRIYAIGPYHKTAVLHETGESDLLSRDIYFLKNNAMKAEPLGLSIAACMQNRYRELLNYDCLVAVPQHKDELHEDEHTGKLFNPVDPLVSWVHKIVGIEIIEPLTKTRKQSMEGLDMSQRHEATIGLYKCVSSKIDGKRVVLVDDVATTGSNLDSCANELIEHGAKEVSAIVCGKDYSS
jgi:predicted amidophosphoribosyltransferase